jgi:hypothetical protein
VAHAVNVLGELARLAGEDDMARAAYEEGLDLVRVLGDQLHQAIFELNLSLLALRAGDLEHARALSRAGLRLAIGLRRQVLAANALIAVAGVETARGAHGHAARMLGAGEAALRSLGASLGPGDRRDHLRSRAQLGAALGDSHLADLVAEGARLSIAAASAEALAAT